MGEAIADGIITVYPFMGYEPVRPKAVQKYLTDEELQRLMTTPLHRQTLYLVRDMFLFSCFTGISYRDMRSLTKENLSLAEDGTWWIKSARQKTKIEFEIPLLDLPLQILKKYSDAVSDNRLLPMYCNSNMNLYLKEIARICNINRPLVFHCTSHSKFFYSLNISELSILKNVTANDLETSYILFLSQLCNIQRTL